MDKYLVSPEQLLQNPTPIRRHGWKRSLIELNGRFESKYRHEISGLLMQSYSEIGTFPHLYHIDGVTCPTHLDRNLNGVLLDQVSTGRQGISSLEFDTKGIYLASVTKSGCLTVHDFESLYCQSNDLSPCLKEDENKHLLHLSTHQPLDVVKWNPANQDEVACTSTKCNEVLIFDISYISSDPVEFATPPPAYAPIHSTRGGFKKKPKGYNESAKIRVLRKRRNVSIHGYDIRKGLSDIAFTSDDHSRILASNVSGAVDVWDRRMSDLPCLELITNSQSTLNSIQIDVENQIVYGAGKLGIIYMWDLRGGRSSAAFQNYKGVSHPPLTSLKVASLLEKIGSLKAQSDIVSKEVHSIALDPSCPYQLAFHLDDGWSGVLNIHNLQVTHIHCPPPAWLNGSNMSNDLSCLRKPSWSPSSIFAVGSSSSNGIYLLDFYPDPSSPCHVDYKEDIQHISGVNNKNKQNSFVHLSEGVTACAIHPLNGAIIAGTKHSSLLLISQRHQSCQGGDICLNNEEDQ